VQLQLNGRLLAVAIISAVILIVTFTRPAPRPGIVPPSAVTSPFMGVERQAPLSGPQATPAPISGLLIPLAQLDITAAAGLFGSADQQALAAELQEALGYVSGRFGSGPRDRIRTTLGLAAGCGLNGIAYTDVREVQVFTCAELPRARAVNIMAHEFVHQLSHDRYGDRHLQSDLILSEGVATWGAGRYWLGDSPSFRAFVRPYLDGGSLLPLAMSYQGQGVAVMNQLYYQWASFVEFLIEQYGRESFDALYITGAGAPGSANYAGVYGKGLDVLEAEWRTWLR
jgi:hypothetical protein